MRIVRFEEAGSVRLGESVDDRIRELDGSPYTSARQTGRCSDRSRVRLRHPASLSKIIGIGLNYRVHATAHYVDLPVEPLKFFKAPSALIGPEEGILLPGAIGTVDLEGELVVVIRPRRERSPGGTTNTERPSSLPWLPRRLRRPRDHERNNREWFSR